MSATLRVIKSRVGFGTFGGEDLLVWELEVPYPFLLI
jgi:hypothetical protein